MTLKNKPIEVYILQNNNISVSRTVVSDSVLYETIKFTFPESWTGYTKTAVFRNGDTVLSVVLNGESDLCTGEDECYIPHEVIKAPEFTVSVFGVLGESRATTPQAAIRVIPSGYGEGDEPQAPTPSEYQQLINLSNETKQIAQSVRDDADNGLFKGEKGDPGATGQDGYTPVKGKDYFTEEDIAELNIPAVDQTYTPESANAQSGTAVKQAVDVERLNRDKLEYYGTTDIEITNPGYFTYTDNGDGTCAVTGLTDDGKTNLTNIVIPYEISGLKVIKIADGAFREYSFLTSIFIPDSVLTIGNSAFEYCDGLASITIGNNVTDIDNYAFSGCTNLTSITIPNGVTSINSGVFFSCAFTRVVIPDSVTNIGDGAFNCCDRLTNITIPDGVTSIGDSAFGECTSLTSITIPDGVTSIGYATFIYCTDLTSVVIPNSVTIIAPNAFEGCSNLTTLITEQGSYAETYMKEHYPNIAIRYDVVGVDKTYNPESENAQSGKAVGEALDENVGSINAVFGTMLEGSRAIPDSLVTKMTGKLYGDMATRLESYINQKITSKTGARYKTRILKHTGGGSITLEPNCIYGLVSEDETGSITLFNEETGENVQLAGKYLGVITGNYGDISPEKVVGFGGAFSGLSINRGTYTAISADFAGSLSWGGAATTVEIRNEVTE